ncbi:uncharacterized protein N7458_003842 [Penicillium daleae]|uniref:RBR-type E3 ubiquitin transferase n=1 Tax=Penicillium daleae TaxID=63821 RepID=A0AAD6C9A4_9EURO|nr:uncharacterized protein N7458_003842 [Penicillium daleae]KAJ5455578.1 hypothetical protein N7458_003842 [Penicillium daleae]
MTESNENTASRPSPPTGNASLPNPLNPKAPSPPLNTIDPESAALIRQLLRQDVDEISNTGKGKQPSRGPSDTELALEHLNNQLREQEQLHQDLVLARSLDRAVQDDGAAIALFQQEEAMARADRQLACRLARIECAPELMEQEPFDAETMYRMNAATAGPSGSVSRGHTNTGDARPSEQAKRTRTSPDPATPGPGDACPQKRLRAQVPESSTLAERSRPPAAPRIVCVSCNESYEPRDIFRALCTHDYCTACLVKLVEHALLDETRFPPRCCGRTLPLSLIRTHIGPELTQRHEEKTIEQADLSKTYCSNKICSAYILPDRVSGYIGTCRSCQVKTCTICKEEAHEGDCQPAANELLELAVKQKWQKCPCGHVIELNIGCNHITCRCGREFCYVCGKQWKTCECATWEENRLLEARARQAAAPRRNAVVNQPAVQPAAAAAPQQQVVQPAVAPAPQVQVCNHPGRWPRVDGEHECQLCEDIMEEYILHSVIRPRDEELL